MGLVDGLFVTRNDFVKFRTRKLGYISNKKTDDDA